MSKILNYIRDHLRQIAIGAAAVAVVLFCMALWGCTLFKKPAGITLPKLPVIANSATTAKQPAVGPTDELKITTEAAAGKLDSTEAIKLVESAQGHNETAIGIAKTIIKRQANEIIKLENQLAAAGKSNTVTWWNIIAGVLCAVGGVVMVVGVLLAGTLNGRLLTAGLILGGWGVMMLLLERMVEVLLGSWIFWTIAGIIAVAVIGLLIWEIRQKYKSVKATAGIANIATGVIQKIKTGLTDEKAAYDTILKPKLVAAFAGKPELVTALDENLQARELIPPKPVAVIPVAETTPPAAQTPLIKP